MALRSGGLKMHYTFINHKCLKMAKSNNKSQNSALRKTPVISRSEIAFLCNTLDEMFDRFQISSSFFYGEKEDEKVRKKIHEISSKNGL